MARLSNEEWLSAAKKLAVGGQGRIRHGRESRDNLIIGNKDDRWWAYCQACKCGAVENKTHVLLVPREPAMSRSLTLPTDRRIIPALKPHEQQALAEFLAAKHMDFMYLPPDTQWSAERQRLLVPTQMVWRDTPGHVGEYVITQWMGRDTSGRSPQKWLTYNGQHYVGEPDARYAFALLVEDTFSYYKVAHALAGTDLKADVYCTLGTAIHDTLFLELLQHHRKVVSFYDGDEAGWRGALVNAQRLTGAGIGHPAPHGAQCAPAGLDPKDMTSDQIQAHVRRLYSQI